MTKYSSVRPRQAPKPDRPHAVWRGIGCLMILIMPLMSFAAARIAIDYGLEHGWPIPYQLLGTPALPDFFYDVPAFMFLIGPITSWTHFYAYAAGTLLFMMIFSGLLSFGYAAIYGLVGPSRWGPLDVPPPKGVKPRTYKR